MTYLEIHQVSGVLYTCYKDVSFVDIKTMKLFCKILHSPPIRDYAVVCVSCSYFSISLYFINNILVSEILCEDTGLHLNISSIACVAFTLGLCFKNTWSLILLSKLCNSDCDMLCASDIRDILRRSILTITNPFMSPF